MIMDVCNFKDENRNQDQSFQESFTDEATENETEDDRLYEERNVTNEYTPPKKKERLSKTRVPIIPLSPIISEENISSYWIPFLSLVPTRG